MEITRKWLITLFTFEKPYALSFQYRKKCTRYKDHLPILKELLKEGLIKQVKKTTKVIEFAYIGQIPPKK
jgi:hypothetical protein